MLAFCCFKILQHLRWCRYVEDLEGIPSSFQHLNQQLWRWFPHDLLTVCYLGDRWWSFTWSMGLGHLAFTFGMANIRDLAGSLHVYYEYVDVYIYIYKYVYIYIPTTFMSWDDESPSSFPGFVWLPTRFEGTVAVMQKETITVSNYHGLLRQ